jgi:hypothetical protein
MVARLSVDRGGTGLAGRDDGRRDGVLGCLVRGSSPAVLVPGAVPSLGAPVRAPTLSNAIGIGPEAGTEPTPAPSPAGEPPPAVEPALGAEPKPGP